jgi:hypothetical protein
MIEKTSTAEIDWGTLGEERWRELGQATGSSELQLRFAVLRFGGMSAGAAAKLSGYAGTDKSWRRVGYDAVRSTAVQNLLELAAVNAPEDARISDKEIDARIAKLVRSPDPNVSLKAVEAHAKRQAVRRELEATKGDNPTWDESAVELLGSCGEMGVGVVAVLALAEGVDISYSPLKEIAPHIKRDWPDIWGKMLSQIGRNNPDTQARWIEYGDAPLLDLGKFAKSAVKGNGAARPSFEPEGASDHAAI